MSALTVSSDRIAEAVRIHEEAEQEQRNYEARQRAYERSRLRSVKKPAPPAPLCAEPDCVSARAVIRSLYRQMEALQMEKALVERDALAALDLLKSRLVGGDTRGD